MLQHVDDALMSATNAKKKTSEEADKAFENAVRKLGDYEREYYTHRIVVEDMKKAEETDKSSLKFLNRLRENFRVREELITLLHRILTLISSRRRRNRRG